MKNMHKKGLVALVVSACLAVTGQALADSSYGYQSSGTGGVSAKANVKVTVTVPELVVLRVGSADVIDELKLKAQATVSGAPGLITADGNNKTATWDNTATPTLASDSKSVNMFVWTNANNVKLTCSSDTGLSTINLAPKDIKVASSGDINHPGTTTECAAGTNTAIPRTKLSTATWTYSVDATALSAAYAGTATQTTTYTAANI